MNPSEGRWRRWLVALCGAALAVATSGCSWLIAHSSVSSAGEIYKPETRAEVRAEFGEADETGTCPDGRPVELRWIRMRVPSVYEGAKDWLPPGKVLLSPGGVFLVGLAEVVATPVQAYRSEQAKHHYVFVYGADDRVVYRYHLAAAPPQRFGEVVNWLAYPLSKQLDEGGCPSWEACLSAFAAEVRHLGACVGYPLTPEDEETLHLLQALAADVDAGRLAPDETLAELKWCLRSTPLSCLRP
jgi:hypothetical protein